MDPDNFKPLSYLGEIPWAASSSGNHKVTFELSVNQLTLLSVSLYFILKPNKGDAVQVFHIRKTEKPYLLQDKDGVSEVKEWGDDLRGAIFLISSMYL